MLTSRYVNSILLFNGLLHFNKIESLYGESKCVVPANTSHILRKKKKRKKEICKKACQHLIYK